MIKTSKILFSKKRGQMDIKKIEKLLEELNLNLEKIKNEKNIENTDPIFVNLKSNIENLKKEVKPESEFEQLRDIWKNDFDELKNILNSEEWPEAVLEFQIADENSEEDKADRAEGVIDILVQEVLENKKFLDFGCGEGHMAKYASKECVASVGYDVVKSKKSKLNWEVEENKHMLTTDFEKVKEKGPYDIILIYDVLDHANNPVEVLNQAKSVLSENGKIYLRCHPWCGRHGGHLYRQMNKAFVHVVFTDSELKKLGLKYEEKINKVIRPILDYKLTFIKEAGLKVVSEDIENQDVENFFKKNKLVSERLKKAIDSEIFPEFQMKQCFHDYVLTR